MTRAMLMYKKRLEDEQGREFFLEYYLLTDEVFFASNVLEIYGAEIKMLRPDGTLAGGRRLRGITPFGPKITELISRMAEGLVTPATMRDVVEDLIPL